MSFFLSSLGGPLFVLRWFGVVCPCLEKDNDLSARQALLFINTHGRRIHWVRPNESSNNAVVTAIRKVALLGSLFGSNGTVTNGGGETTNCTSVSSNSPLLARLVLRDGEDGHPEIWIQAQTDKHDASSQPQPLSLEEKEPCIDQLGTVTIRIPLRRVDRVTLDGNFICLYAKMLTQHSSPSKLLSLSPSNAQDNATKLPKELARFELLTPKLSKDVSPLVAASNEDRNMFVHYLSVLIEWERQRCQETGYCDDDDIDSENFLTKQARKAAHFARREVELQHIKRDRDRRKAKFVEESGGLKFTALAMASRGNNVSLAPDSLT